MQAKNSKGTKECTVDSQSFFGTQAMFTNFSGLPGKYQQCVCTYVCHLFFPSLCSSAITYGKVVTVTDSSGKVLGISLNSVTPKLCGFGQMISPPCA